MTAIADLSEVRSPWVAVAACVALVLAVAVIARRDVIRERQAERELRALTRKRMAAEAHARGARNTAAFEQHRAERAQYIAVVAHEEATGPHGVAYIEALANGLVDQ